MTRPEVTASHEAGHAVVAHALGARVVGVTLDPPEADADFSRVADRVRGELATLAAGDAAVRRFLGREPRGRSGRRATRRTPLGWQRDGSASERRRNSRRRGRGRLPCSGRIGRPWSGWPAG